GIGRSIALAFAQAGADTVVLLSRTKTEIDQVAAEIRDRYAATKAVTYTCDISSISAVREVISNIKRDVGVVDIVVNNAGRAGNGNSYLTDLEDFWNVQETNQKSVQIPTLVWLPDLIKNGGGTVINVSSLAAIIVGHPLISPAYLLSKAAVNRFGESLHAAHQKDNIKVFTYHPGRILTSISENLPDDVKHMLNDTLELPAGFAVWLASGNADFLAGRFVSANWDVDELQTKKEQILEKDSLKFKIGLDI
ncbi:hypothetical protein DFJ77DRAFT_428827, partial [Powellomyces hirtus]